MAVCTSSSLASFGPSHHGLASQSGHPLSPSPPSSLSPRSSSPSFSVFAKGNATPFDPASLIANGRSVPLIASVPLSTVGSSIARFIGPGMLSGYIPATVSPRAEELAGIDKVFQSLIERYGLRSKDDGKEVGSVGFLVFALNLHPTDTDGEQGERRGDLQGLFDALREYLHKKVQGAEPAFDILPIRDHIVSMAPEKELAIGRIPQAETGAGWILTVKIAGALASMGYGFEDVRKVARLGNQNVATVSCSSISASTEIAPTEELSTQDSVKKMLALLLHQSSNSDPPGLVRLHVNSNEPVLLLNVHASTPISQLRVLLTHTIAQLHDTYHIRPVRVYAGEYNIRGPDRDGDGREKKEFSISILNVVNTEIGGPSMIHLLDEPCGAEGWRVGVTKEEWETCDGSTATVVQLGVRNWEANVDLSGDVVRSMRPASTDGDNVNFDDTERLEDEAEKSVPGTGAQQQQVAGDKAAEYNEFETSAAKDLEEDSLEREVVDATEQYQGEATEQDAPEHEEVEIGADQLQTIKESDENLVETGSKEAINKEAEQVMEDSKYTPPVGPGSRGPASDEEYEIVDRERTLIDMVFGQVDRG